MSRELTIKERKFAELVVELGNQSEAYRQVFKPKNSDKSWIRTEATKLMQRPNITQTVNQLKILGLPGSYG